MIYRRVTEVTEIDQPTIPELPNYWNQQPSFGQTGFDNKSPTLGPFLKRKRTMESWEDLSLSEEVRSFKRVRVLSNIKKARRAAFTSWEKKAPWVATELGKTHSVSFHGNSEDKSSWTTDVGTPFRDFPARETIVPDASLFPSSAFRQSEDLAHTSDSEDDDRGSAAEHCEPATNTQHELLFYSERYRNFEVEYKAYCASGEGRLVRSPRTLDLGCLTVMTAMGRGNCVVVM